MLTHTRFPFLICFCSQVGVLPVPHAIVVRKYQANKYTGLWFKTYLWGVIYMRNQEMPLWDGSNIKIFTVHEAPAKIETVNTGTGTGTGTGTCHSHWQFTHFAQNDLN